MNMAKQELLVVENGFNYGLVENDEAAKLRCLAKEIQRQKAAFVVSVMGIGERLASAHEVMSKYKTGTFLKWVELECGFSKTTAYRHLNAYRVFSICSNLEQMEDSALYVLAQNDTPETARKEAIKLAGKGTRITHKQAKAIIKRHKPNGGSGGSSLPSPPPPAQPPKPELTKDEQLKIELKKVRSYVEGLVRALDDANRIKRNTVIHPQSLKLCGQILEGLERW